MTTPKDNFVLSNKKPSQGNLNKILINSAKLAKKKNLQPFLYISAKGCQPCAHIENNLDHPLLKQVFNGCYLIKIDYNNWMVQLFKNHIHIKSVPFFVRISDEGEITEHMFAAGDWEDDTPESIATHLEPYFADRNNKKVLDVTGKMLCERLIWDIFTADLAQIKYAILTAGCSPFQLVDENTYLHNTCTISKEYATEDEVIHIAKFFIDQHIEINKQNNLGRTALLESIHSQYYELAKLLIESGADVSLGDKKGQQPIHRAVFNCVPDLVKILIENGADANVQDDRGRTPLHLVPTYDINLARYLLENGADVNIPYTQGNTAFHYLISQSYYNDKLSTFIKLYLENGADLTRVNQQGLLPIEMVDRFTPPKPHHKTIKPYLRKAQEPSK